MKALTICQPYAELIARGDKRVENREWPTSYRGPLLIHAGKSRTWLEGQTVDELNEEFGRTVEFGAIVAKANLVACLHIDRIERGEYDKTYPWLKGGPHVNGTWCWVLENVERLPAAITWTGAQGLWNCDAFDSTDNPTRPRNTKLTAMPSVHRISSRSSPTRLRLASGRSHATYWRTGCWMPSRKVGRPVTHRPMERVNNE